MSSNDSGPNEHQPEQGGGGPPPAQGEEQPGPEPMAVENQPNNENNDNQQDQHGLPPPADNNNNAAAPVGAGLQISPSKRMLEIIAERQDGRVMAQGDKEIVRIGNATTQPEYRTFVVGTGEETVEFEVDCSVLQLKSECFEKLLDPDGKFKEARQKQQKEGGSSKKGGQGAESDDPKPKINLPTYTGEDFARAINFILKMEKSGQATDEEAMSAAPFFQEYLFMDARAWVDSKVTTRVKAEAKLLSRADGARDMDISIITRACSLIREKHVNLPNAEKAIKEWLVQVLRSRMFPIGPGILSATDVGWLQAAFAQISQENGTVNTDNPTDILPHMAVIAPSVILSLAFPTLFVTAWELHQAYKHVSPPPSLTSKYRRAALPEATARTHFESTGILPALPMSASPSWTTPTICTISPSASVNTTRLGSCAGCLDLPAPMVPRLGWWTRRGVISTRQ